MLRYPEGNRGTLLQLQLSGMLFLRFPLGISFPGINALSASSLPALLCTPALGLRVVPRLGPSRWSVFPMRSLTLLDPGPTEAF